MSFIILLVLFFFLASALGQALVLTVIGSVLRFVFSFWGLALLFFIVFK